MSKPMMFILILAVVAILAFVGLYAYRSSSVRFQGAQQVEKQEVEEGILEDEETNDEEIEEETESNTEEVEDQEDATFPDDTIIEEDLTPSL